MNFKQIYQFHHRFMFLKAWYFLLPALVFAFFAINGLRSNFSTMVQLREAVYTADQQNGDVEAALHKLRAHVYSHMNTNLTSGSNPIKPPIQLKSRYDRLVAVEQERVKQANAQVSSQGEQICGARYPSGGFNAPRVACIQDYVGANAVKAKEIPEQLYKFDFVSPRWSVDQAGVSILLSGFFSVLFVARVGLEYYVRKRLQQ